MVSSVRLTLKLIAFWLIKAYSMGTDWEITYIELRGNPKKFKVTRKILSLAISKTKVFLSKKKALNQIARWLE